MNVHLIGLRQMSVISGMNKWLRMPTCARGRRFLMDLLHMGLKKERDYFLESCSSSSSSQTETESSRRDVGIIFSVLFIEKKRDVEEVAVALLLLFFIVNNELPSQDSSEIFYLIWFLHKESPREERQHGNVPWSKWLLNIPRASLWEWHKQRPEAVIWQ